MTYDLLFLFVVTLLIVILYEKSRMFKYYFKFIIFAVGTVTTSSIFIPLMLFKPCDYRNGLFPAWGARQVSSILGLKWKMRGHENIVQEEGTVILINHQSVIDVFVLAQIWPVFQRCTVISKKAVFYFWPFGLAAWLWGTVFIDRSSRKDAQAGVNKAATTITSRKAKICLFPEGTRHGGEKLLSFKKGAFHIAIESQAPIQPIVVQRYSFLDYNVFRFDQSTSIISILPAISTKGLTKDDINDLIEKTYNIMNKEYDVINSEKIK